jgi:hypothetical protein
MGELLGSIAIIGGLIGLFCLVVMRRGWAQLLLVATFLIGTKFTVVWLVSIPLFWLLVVDGAVRLLNDAGDAVKSVTTTRREVHHYHRVTIDREGNIVESTEYTEEK